MKIPIYQVDAFTSEVFGGNPAAVCPLKEWLPTDVLQKIAMENYLPETAFFIQKNKQFEIRWFTPEIEMDLCGHATLAAAHVIHKHLGYKESINFQSKSGLLVVEIKNNIITLNFPAREPTVISKLPDVILEGIGKKPIEVLKSRDYVLVYENEEIIKNIKPNKELLNTINLDPGGIIITAKGDNVDFVSRFFTPHSSIFEDPVTGSAHCSLIPYWSEKLQKKELIAQQLSARKGELACVNLGNRVLISGNAVTYLEGMINI
jgi:PhzF family phenazine biosynthesis protein